MDGEPVPRGDLAAALDRTSNGDRERRVFVEADKSVAYGEVMALMNDLRAAGRLKIGLVGIEFGPPAVTREAVRWSLAAAFVTAADAGARGPPPPPQPEPAPPAEAQATVEPPALPPGAAPAPPPSAPSAVSAHVADVAAAPARAPGSEETVSPPVLRRWRQELIGQIERRKRYPAGAQGHGGVAKVAFAIDEGGGLISIRIAASSGSPVLDEAAIDLIRAAPFPPLPRGLGESELNFVAPIRYLGAAGR